MYYKKGNIGIIEFNDPNSKVNLLSSANLDTLNRIVDSVIETEANIKALFFRSEKKDIFIAGADIKELARINTKEEALQLCKKGQELFDKIEQLTMPTFAVVNGACVGGGLELALSCEYILATKNKKVKLGFPEARLEITPGFGGPHRLAEKIGKKHADYLVNTGMLLNLKEAKRLKIVDRVIPESHQFSYQKLIKICKRHHGVVARRAVAKKEVRAKFNQSEREVLAEKMLQERAKNSLASYLLISKYRDYPWLDGAIENLNRIKRCAVIGAGTMGKGIAYLISLEGNFSISLVDLDNSTLKKAREYIKNTYRDAVKRHILYNSEARLRFSNICFGKVQLRDEDIIVESITEDISAKKALFAEIEREVREDCILATNTSCLSIEKLSKSLKHAERFIGIHFFNPAYKMKLVELAPTRFTGKLVLKKVILFLRQMRRIPVIVKDSPGFLVNRMLLPYLNEAVFMLEQGFLAEDIENAMLEFGMPMGPLELLGEIGLDVAYKASKMLEENFGSRLKVPESLRACPKKILQPHRKKKRLRVCKDISERLLGPIKREAELCLEEGVVGSRDVIDLALLLGIGFPASKRLWTNKTI